MVFSETESELDRSCEKAVPRKKCQSSDLKQLIAHNYGKYPNIIPAYIGVSHVNKSSEGEKCYTEGTGLCLAFSPLSCSINVNQHFNLHITIFSH